MAIAARKKILGIGYPRFAVKEWEALAAAYEVHYFVPGDRAQVISEVKRLCEEHGPFDAAYVLFGTSAYSPFHPDMLSPLFSTPGVCGLFAQAGAGYDDVDYEWLAANGCYLSNTPTAVTAATADSAIMLMLAAIRDMSKIEKQCREGKWKYETALSDDPYGKTVGIVGMGNIGKSFAKKTHPWDMKLIYHTRRRLSDKEEAELRATWVPFDELLAQSDVISLNCPLTDETRNLLSDKEFAKMKDGVFIVNTARGAVIDEPALIRALDSGKVARAGLDVFVGEPVFKSPFYGRDDVTVQPHTGAYTKGTFATGEKVVFANVKAFLETGKPNDPCNAPVKIARAETP